MRKLALTLALASNALAGCSNGGPATPSRPCRKWTLRYSTGGVPFACVASPTAPSCSAVPIDYNLTITWSYRSQSDFVHEADVPNRILALSRITLGCGTFVTEGCNTSLVKFAYDAQSRLVRRERSSSHNFGAGEISGGAFDVVTYTAWDRHGRPTQGQLQKDGQTAPLTVIYDDIRRRAQASNGELVEQDTHGNVIREVEIRAGSSYETLYTIEALQDVCEGGA
jgi:hypothetical protein